MSEFGRTYSDAYDALYGDKDYGAECQTIISLLDRYGSRPPKNLLDLGCGSGNHAIPLAAAGLAVTGVDRSATMLAHARRKAADAHLDRATFEECDLRICNLERTFDAVLMMFAVLGYQVENNDVIAALRTARRHLQPGGLLIFDCWYGPAVLNQRPSDRSKTVNASGGEVTRFTSSELDQRTHTCRVNFRVRHGSQTANEIHTVRFFFPRELELFLDLSGFSLIRLGAFPNIDSEPDESTWNVLGVARAER